MLNHSLKIAADSLKNTELKCLKSVKQMNIAQAAGVVCSLA
jgi:hypothetical protein